MSSTTPTPIPAWCATCICGANQKKRGSQTTSSSAWKKQGCRCDITHLMMKGRGCQWPENNVNDPVGGRNVGLSDKAVIDVTVSLHRQNGVRLSGKYFLVKPTSYPTFLLKCQRLTSTDGWSRSGTPMTVRLPTRVLMRLPFFICMSGRAWPSDRWNSMSRCDSVCKWRADLFKKHQRWTKIFTMN